MRNKKSGIRNEKVMGTAGWFSFVDGGVFATHITSTQHQHRRAYFLRRPAMAKKVANFNGQTKPV